MSARGAPARRSRRSPRTRSRSRPRSRSRAPPRTASGGGGPTGPFPPFGHRAGGRTRRHRAGARARRRLAAARSRPSALLAHSGSAMAAARPARDAGGGGRRRGGASDSRSRSRRSGRRSSTRPRSGACAWAWTMRRGRRARLGAPEEEARRRPDRLPGPEDGPRRRRGHGGSDPRPDLRAARSLYGSGGTLVELLADVAFRLHPLTDRRRGRHARGGPRHRAPARLSRRGRAKDEGALRRLFCGLSALVDACPEVREMDLNPVKVLERGVCGRRRTSPCRADRPLRPRRGESPTEAPRPATPDPLVEAQRRNLDLVA